MRKIGTISGKEDGERFADYLFSCGIQASLDSLSDAQVAVWVEDEDRLLEAESLLRAFLQNPAAEAYADAKRMADKKRQAEKQAAAVFARQVFNRDRISRRARWTSIPVTRILVLVSIVVTVWGGLGSNSELVQWLSITRYGNQEGWLAEVLRGQVWRLFTPVFLHASLWEDGFGFLHVLFNMLWLMDLGGMLERAQGRVALVGKVAVIGVVSNLLQYTLSGPAFGGMSGVVFGLLGYCWVRGRQDVTSGLYVHPRIMFMMTFWFFLGFSSRMPIANAAHFGGLVSGLLWGYLSIYQAQLRRD